MKFSEVYGLLFGIVTGMALVYLSVSIRRRGPRDAWERFIISPWLTVILFILAGLFTFLKAIHP